MIKPSKATRYNRIKAELTEAGKKNIELASYMGAHASTVSDWCTNTNQPSIQDLFRIAEFLKINVRRLLVSTSDWETETTFLTQAAESDPVPKSRPRNSKNKSKRKPKNSK